MKTKQFTLIVSLLLFFSTVIDGHSQRKKKSIKNSTSPVSTVNAESLQNDVVNDATALLNNLAGITIIPRGTVGAGVGVGFTNDFDQTTICITGEYLRRISLSDNNRGWYFGGEGSYHNINSNAFMQNIFKIGPKIQNNIPITPSQQTQAVIGIMAVFQTGNIDNNGFKEDFNGYQACIYAGVNMRISESWSVGLQFPVLNYEDVTFKPESGGEFNANETTLLLNKNNPLKIMVRKSLFDKN